MNRELFIADFKNIFLRTPWEEMPDKVADYVEGMRKNKVHQKGVCRVDKDKIITFCCEKLMTTLEDMVRRDRTEEIKYKRQVTMLFLCRRGGMSTPQVGKLFNRDHTTVRSSMQRIDDLMDTDPAIKEEIELLNSQL